MTTFPPPFGRQERSDAIWVEILPGNLIWPNVSSPNFDKMARNYTAFSPLPYQKRSGLILAEPSQEVVRFTCLKLAKISHSSHRLSIHFSTEARRVCSYTQKNYTHLHANTPPIRDRTVHTKVRLAPKCLVSGY